VLFDLVMPPLWLSPWYVPFSFYMSPHCDLSFHKFMQCLSVFFVLLCVFASDTCLILCGTESALLVFVVIIPFSHNIVASLCHCNVDCFILVVAILKYDYKPALNIVVRKLFVVGTCKP
jgi:hypothetical protein